MSDKLTLEHLKNIREQLNNPKPPEKIAAECGHDCYYPAAHPCEGIYIPHGFMKTELKTVCYKCFIDLGAKAIKDIIDKDLMGETE